MHTIKVIKNCSQLISYLNDTLKLSDREQRDIAAELIEKKVFTYKNIHFFYDPFDLLD